MARKLKNWIESYLSYTSHFEAPEVFHFWTAVGTIGGALRRKVFIDQVEFQWVPNFYIIFVAVPGIVNKSSTAGIGERMLRELNTIQFGPNSCTWQALTQSLSEVAEMVPIENGPDPLTTKHLAMSCLTFFASELGSLLDANDNKMLDVLTDLWDGKLTEWKKNTKTSGNDTIPNPWINIIACTTPKWMSENMNSRVMGGGFASRCIFVHAEAKRNLVPYPKLVVPTNHGSLREDLVHDLGEIANLRGEVLLTPDAVEWGIKWYHDHYAKYADYLKDSDMVGYVARKQSHLHKLAMVLSAAESDDLMIERKHLEQALQIMNEVEKGFTHVVADVHAKPEQDQARRLLAIIGIKKKIPVNILYKMVFKEMSSTMFDEAIKSCVRTEMIKLQQIGNAMYAIASDILISTLAESDEKPSE